MMKFLISTILYVFAGSAFAQWTFVNKVDEFTDKPVRYAVYNDANHQIQLSYQGSSVWMFISRKKIGSFKPSGIIEMRVDKNDPFVVDPARSKMLAELTKRPHFQWEPGTVGFQIWHGQERESCGYVGQLLKGQELKIRYQLNSMDRDTFTANLVGAKDAITKGLGLSVCGQ
jgi:hypothetical protein